MKITVYSKPDCGACDTTKMWLDSNGIEYESINAFEDKQALIDLQEHGYMSFPVVKVGDNFDNVWTGFEINRLQELL